MSEFEQNPVPFSEEEPVPQIQTPPVPRPMPPRKRGAGRLIAAVLACGLLGASLGVGGVLLYQHLSDNGQVIADGGDTLNNDVQPTTPSENHSTILEGQRENTVIDIVEIDTSRVMTPAEVYAANVGSTVGITTSITTNYWGYQSTSAASGSGFLYSDDGYILTNFHVVEDSDSITVSLYSGEEYDALLVGYDEENDIAVLKIEAQGLSPVVIGDSDNLNVGDEVIAIGNPLGELTFSLTYGMISAKDREVTFSNNVTMNLLQTDCAINSGNSGGALFNLYGEVIGITNAKYSGSGTGASIDNIGFAIPMNSIREIVDSIIENGYVSKPYIGVSVSDVNERYQLYGLPAGAAVEEVVNNSPADEAGLQIGDIIIAVGETSITGAQELIDAIGECAPGDELQLTVYRRGGEKTLTVTVGERIQSYQHDS